MSAERSTWVTRVGGANPRRALATYTLKVLNGADVGKEVRVESPRFRLGALEGNGLQLQDPAVSGLLPILGCPSSLSKFARAQAHLVLIAPSLDEVRVELGKLATRSTRSIRSSSGPRAPSGSSRPRSIIGR